MTQVGHDCDVLVVGAGPTGLLAANLLVRAGVRVRIVEKRAEASRESRAFAIQARTLELMQSIGLSDEFLAHGVMATGIEIHVQGKRRGGLNLDRSGASDTPFPFILMIPQSDSERILIADLARLGLEVERSCDFVGASEHGTGVTSIVQDADGKQNSIKSQYILGADGARSAVRDAFGFKFDGGSYAQSFLLADCKVDWTLDHQSFRVFINGRRIGLFLPLQGTRMSRIMMTDLSNAEGDASKPVELDLAHMQAAFADAVGIPVRLSDPVWVTRYRAHHRAADAYRTGRAFVAGDAAHIHSPAGGQGMNTGLQDAANLAWKLAAVIQNGADDELLDTYHDERKPVGELVVRSTGKLFSAAAGQSGWRAVLRDEAAKLLLPLISHVPRFHRNAFFNISERNVAYPVSRYVVEGPRWPRKGPRAGERAPNATINERLTMFDLLAGYRFSLIALSRRVLSEAEAVSTRMHLEEMCARHGFAQAHLIARLPRGANSNVCLVTRPDVFDLYGVDGHECDAAIYIVRPDTYIACRTAGLDIDACSRFLQEVLPNRCLSVNQLTLNTGPALAQTEVRAG